MSCMNDCLQRVYEYGPPKNFRTLEPKSGEFFPVPKSVTNYKELVSRAQAIIDAKPKTTCNCEDKGCECVPDKVQDKPYPKESQTVTRSGWLGMTKFDYTVKFTTYTGQCDDTSGGEFRCPVEDGKR
jgi:hypothetical protein